MSVKKETIFEPALAETIPLIHADKVFAKSVQGTSYVVAVIDSGVSKTSPMLAGKVISEACYSSNIPALILRCIYVSCYEPMNGKYFWRRRRPANAASHKTERQVASSPSLRGEKERGET